MQFIIYGEYVNVIVKADATDVVLDDTILDQLYEIGKIEFNSANKKSLTELNIPDIYTYTDGKKYRIIGIAEYALYECDLIASLTIPDTVTFIEKYAFDKCYSIPDLVIPDSVITIGDWCFANCTSMESAIIGNGVKNNWNRRI